MEHRFSRLACAALAFSLLAGPVLAYDVQPGAEPGTFEVENQRHGWRARFGADEARVQPLEGSTRVWELVLRTVGYGTEDGVAAVSRGGIRADANRVEIDRGALVEWYVNDDRGLEQGFTLRHAPPAAESATLFIDIELGGRLTPILDGAGRWLDFAMPEVRFAVLRFGGLKVADATGRELPARLDLTTWEPRGTRALRIAIEAKGASYPIHVDPLLTTPSWSSFDAAAGSAAAWGDWDGDGDLDLAVGNSGRANRVYENTGGTLAPAWASTEVDATESLAWGDWDGDGDLDLAVGNLDQPNRVYSNDDGMLSLAWASDEAEATTSVAWGDLGGDGKLDLAVGNHGAPNRVYEVAGDSMELAWSSDEDDDTTGLAWGDWNGDGAPDLAVANSNQPNRIYRNDGGRLLLDWSSFEADETTSIALGDCDGDRDLDLVVGNDGQPNRLYVNDSSGSPLLAWSSPESDRTQDVALGDLEGDGDPDLAVANVGEANRVYANTGGQFDLAWSSDSSGATSAVAWGDWNGDGNLDLAVTNRDQPNRVVVNVPGDFPAVWEASLNELTETVAWGDWDGDGDLDLMVGNDHQPLNGFTGGLKLLRNNGGNFTPIWQSPRKDETRSLAWGDVDGDGDLDLAVGNWSQPNTIYRNDLGAMSLVWSSDQADRTWSVAWGDWDGDGDLDLAVANWQQSNRIYRNQNGTLALAASFGGNGQSNGLAWGDWDGDRDLDLAVANNSEANRVYENTGGRLRLAWKSEALEASTSVAWGDYDGDGDMDLAVGNHSEPNRIYENVGKRLVAAWESAEAETTESVVWGDWDGDGDLDLVVGNEWEFIRLYVNEAGEFRLLQNAGSWDALLRSLAFGDWDSDGDLDLVAANRCPALPNRLYENRRLSASGLPETPVRPVTTMRPGTTPSAYFFSSAERLTEPIIEIPYRLLDAEGDRVATMLPEYSTNGGGRWYPATEAPGANGTQDLSSSAYGDSHVFAWHAAADGVCSDDVVFRINVRSQAPSQIGGPIQQAALSSSTPPFRVGGPTTNWYRDADGDGFGDPATLLGTCRGEQPEGYTVVEGDCGDDDASVFTGAEEINDGHDNQCPGDSGHGLVDEIVTAVEFPDLADRSRYCWMPQSGADEYQVVRSRIPDFSSGCLHVVTAENCNSDAAALYDGELFYYLVRAVAPNAGSFGRDSSGTERRVVCQFEAKPTGKRQNRTAGGIGAVKMPQMQGAIPR